MDVSKNSGTPKSSILMTFSIINHPFWATPIFGNTHILPKLKVIYAILGVKNPYTFPPFFQFFGAEVSTFLGHFFAAAHLRKRKGPWH